MGNTELKAAFKNSFKDAAANIKLGLSADVLIDESLIEQLHKYVTDRMLGGASLEWDKIFPESNVQTNDNSEETFKRQTVKQISNNLLSGFAPAESLLSSISNTSK